MFDESQIPEYNNSLKDIDREIKKYNKSWFVLPLFALAIAGILFVNKCSSKEKNVKTGSEFIDNKSLPNSIKKTVQKTKPLAYFNIKSKPVIFSPNSLKI